MRFGSLFSGIGGLDLGLERAGMTCAWQVEVDDWCRKVLAKHWPDVPRFGDIKELTGDELGPVDLVAGGFPCQPVSFAGRRQAQDDPRWLWPEFARVLRLVRPRFALLENVPGLLTAGFGDVAADLADLGYDFEWTELPAAAVGAPHLRYRVFVVAYANGQGEPVGSVDAGARPGIVVPLADSDREQLRVRPGSVPPSSRTGEGEAPERQRVRADVGDGGTAVAHAHRPRQPILLGSAALDQLTRFRATDGAGWWDVEPDVRGIPDGLSQGLDGDVDVSRGLGSPARSVEASEVRVRAMQERASSWLASPRRGSDEQLTRELADALRQLPHPLALGEREAGLEAAWYVRGLRAACEALGMVRYPLESCAQAWESLSREAQAWAIVGACRGPWHAEWPGVERVSTGVPRRVDRLRGLGNAVVPQVAEFIGRRIMDAA